MYGVITTVPAPVEMYDGMHAAMVSRVGASVDGLLVHRSARATTDGFQTLDVWESRSTSTAPTPTSSSRWRASWRATSLYPRSSRRPKPLTYVALSSPVPTSSSSPTATGTPQENAEFQRCQRLVSSAPVGADPGNGSSSGRARSATSSNVR